MAPEGVSSFTWMRSSISTKSSSSPCWSSWRTAKITLIASTTGEPLFYVFRQCSPRSTVFEFKPITAEDALPAIDRGL